MAGCGNGIAAAGDDQIIFGHHPVTGLGVDGQAAGAVEDIFDMRRIIADSVSMKRFEPKDKAEWDAAYEKYLKVVESKENK